MANTRSIKIPVLMYHEVVQVDERSRKVRRTNPAYTVTVERFREQMAWLSRNGYRTLTLDDVLADGTDLTKSVVITFDDGWDNNYTQAMPILRELGLTATVFVVSGFVGRSRYMTWAQLEEMRREGIAIQSHTVSHRPLTMLDMDEIRKEFAGSKSALKNGLGISVDYVSLPHGVYNKRVIAIARESGYRGICTSEPGFSHSVHSLTIFRRMNIRERHHESKFSSIINMNRMSILSDKASKGIKNVFKRVIGYESYRKLYRALYVKRDVIDENEYSI